MLKELAGINGCRRAGERSRPSGGVARADSTDTGGIVWADVSDVSGTARGGDDQLTLTIRHHVPSHNGDEAHNGPLSCKGGSRANSDSCRQSIGPQRPVRLASAWLFPPSRRHYEETSEVGQRAFRLLCAPAALGATACSSSLACPTGEDCWSLPGGPTGAPLCECGLTNDCSDPFACPSLQCPRRGQREPLPSGPNLHSRHPL